MLALMLALRVRRFPMFIVIDENIDTKG